MSAISRRDQVYSLHFLGDSGLNKAAPVEFKIIIITMEMMMGDV